MLKAFKPSVTICLLFLAARLSLCEEPFTNNHKSFEQELDSWESLRIAAGYFSESGIYQGGLWRRARTIDAEEYHCKNYTETHCTGWTTHEQSRNKVESGTCACDETNHTFCQTWSCTSEHIDRNINCLNAQECSIRVLEDRQYCKCRVASENGRYCQQWSCIDSSSNGYIEHEDYRCVEEDATRAYCFLWKGNVSSEYEVESSACECFSRGLDFCEVWQCTERSLTRCASHRGGWCQMDIAIGMGGGFGALFILLAALMALRSNGLYDRICALSIYSALAMPWLIGVVIWGGLPALWWVVSLWLTWIALLMHVFCRLELLRREANRNIQESSHESGP